MYPYSPWPQIEPGYISEAFARHPHIEKHYAPGEFIYVQEDAPQYLLHVHKGVVKETILDSNGKEKTLALIEEGGSFGITPFIQRQPYFTNAVAVQDCIIYALTQEMMQEVLSKEPEFSYHMMLAMGQKIRLLTFQVEYLTFFDTKRRLIALLLSLVDIYGTEHPKGTLINLRITDQELGGLLGLRREAVTKVINTLRTEGLLIRNNRMLILPDISTLWEILHKSG